LLLLAVGEGALDVGHEVAAVARDERLGAVGVLDDDAAAGDGGGVEDARVDVDGGRLGLRALEAAEEGLVADDALLGLAGGTEERGGEQEGGRAGGLHTAASAEVRATGRVSGLSWPRRQRSWTANSARGSVKSARAWQPRDSSRHWAARATRAPTRSMFWVSQPSGSSKILSRV